MATPAGSARSRERVVRICDPATDARTLRLRLLEEFRRAVGFDAYAWLLTDPETSVGSAPLADVPCLPELPRLIALKYLAGINRWTSLSVRESELLSHLVTGAGTRELAGRMFLSEHTVQDHLKSIFAKTSTHNRRTLLSHVLG